MLGPLEVRDAAGQVVQGGGSVRRELSRPPTQSCADTRATTRVSAQDHLSAAQNGGARAPDGGETDVCVDYGSGPGGSLSSWVTPAMLRRSNWLGRLAI